MDNLTIVDSIPLRHDPSTIVILFTAYLTVLVAGLVGNVFVIVVVIKMPKMKTATKYFILNLAIADLLVLIFCLSPSLLANIFVPWVMGWFMCKAVPYVQGVSVCASVYSLAAISGDRLMAIRFPLGRQVTKRLARNIIVFIWIWGAGLALPWLLYFDLSNAEEKYPSMVFCIEKWPPGTSGNVYFAVVNLGLFYLLPLIFISFCHFIIWLRVRRRQVPTDSSSSQTELVRRRAKASIQKLVIVAVVGFAVCWLSLYAIFVRIKLIPVKLGATEEKVLDYALPVAQWLGAANSCINPILYALFNRNFRFTLQKLLGACSASTMPRSCHNPRHHSQGDLSRTHLFMLSLELYLRQPNNSQLKITSHNTVEPGDSNLVMLEESNLKLAAIMRSKSYQVAMENPC